MILHLSTFETEGGAAIAASRLHQALRRQGVDSQLLIHQGQATAPGITAWADTPRKQKQAWGRFAAERLFFLPYEKNKSVRFAFSPAAVGVPLAQHPLVQRAALINIHWVNFGFLSLTGLTDLLALGKPVVWTLHDMWAFTGGCHYSRACERYQSHCGYCPYLRNPQPYDLSFEIFEEKKRAFTQAPLTLVAPSRWLQQRAEQAALTRDTRAHTIPNPLDTSVFIPKKCAALRQTLGLPIDKKLILFAGANTQDPRKGFAYFRQALDALPALDGQAEVLVFGKSQAAALQSLRWPVHDLGTLTGASPIADAYAAADLMVVPSLEDNLPNTIMEAMACGTPVVGFATGGIPEMIDHRHNGFVADYRSAASLAAGISWILENNAAGRLSTAARQKVTDTYAEAVVATQYRALYDSLL